MQYIVLDMEWNQPWDPKKAVRVPVHLKGEIIQIGAVKLDGNFHIVDTFKVLVSPRYYTKMHSKVSKLTKIKTSTLRDGLSFPEAFALFKAWCGEDFVFLIWGLDDIPMLRDNMMVFGEDTGWIPKWYNVQRIYDAQVAQEGRQHALSDAMERLGETLTDAHDAFNDAYGTALVCLHLDMQKGFDEYASGDVKNKTAKLKLIRQYPSREAAKRDNDLYTFKCPACDCPVVCRDTVSYGFGKEMGIAECDCGKEYFVNIKTFRLNETTFRSERTVAELDDEKRDLFYAKQREKNPVLQS